MNTTGYLVLLLLSVSIATTSAIETESFRLHSVFAHDIATQTTFHHTLQDDIRLAGRINHQTGEMARSLAPHLYSNGPIPDVTSRNTLVIFGVMSNDAYYTPSDTQNWVPLSAWMADNRSYSFGWNDVYLRGYLFTNQHQQAVLAFKGTDFPIVSQTGNQDATQDWLLFSGCGESSSPNYDCGCVHRNYQDPTKSVCEVNCFHQCILYSQVSYLDMAKGVYQASRQLFPTHDFYFTGHSLGGAIAGLLALVEGWPAVTFESPPVRNYAWFLGLNVTEERTSLTPVFNFGALDDSIYCGGNMCGPCIGGGVPIKTVCHIGYMCVWPVPRGMDYGGYFQVYPSHKIDTVADHVLHMDIPECVAYPRCNDWVSHGWNQLTF